MRVLGFFPDRIRGAGVHPGMLIDRVCSLVVHYERLRAQGESPL